MGFRQVTESYLAEEWCSKSSTIILAQAVMKGCTNYNSISGKHSTWMSTSPPVTNDKGLQELIEKKSSKYLLQQVKQGLTDSTCSAHLQVLTRAEADQCRHPYSGTDQIIQNVSLREICSRYVDRSKVYPVGPG